LIDATKSNFRHTGEIEPQDSAIWTTAISIVQEQAIHEIVS